MPTLYNQYIYRDGAWRQTGTSSDSVTYTISLSGDTLTLTGSNGSSSSVTISSGGNEDIFVAEYNVTPYADILAAYNAGKALFAVRNSQVYSFEDYYSTIPRFQFAFPKDGLYIGYVHCDLQNNTTTWGSSSSSTNLGNITAGGDIPGNGVTIASGDRLVINDESASKLNNSSITFGTDTTKYLANDGTWQDIPADSVTSVNSKTGAVTLTASDVGALPSSTTIPSATSDLTNDSNFVSDASYVHTDNNFTDALETKLNGIAEGATVDDHKWNDVALNKTSVANQTNFYVPALSSTSNTTAYLLPSNATPNAKHLAQYDSNAYLNSTTPTAGDNTTKVATTAFVKSAVDTAISGVNSFEYEVVQTLPTTNIKDHTIYLVPKTGTTNDVYDEYMYISSAWEHIGTTDVDLSGYVPTSRTVNNKALSSDITLTASDVGALPSSTTIPAQTAKIWTGSSNSYGSSAVKVVTLDDSTGFSLTSGVRIAVYFAQDGHTDSSISPKLNVNNTGEKSIVYPTDKNSFSGGYGNRLCWSIGETIFFTYSTNNWIFEGSSLLQNNTYDLASNAVPNTRTVNGKALSSDITLTASDVGASATDQKLITYQTTNGSIYYPVVGNSTTNSETKYYNTDFRFRPATNLTELQLGQVSNGSTKAGQLTLCSGAYYTYLKPPSYSVIDNNKTYTLPNATGTIALTSDIPNISGKQDKPTIASATLAVASWSNGVYSFESTYPNASYNIDVEPDGYTITDAQFKAWNEAKIVGNSNGNTIKALGTVPTVAIPVVVRATPK